jgi:uncharacterized protein (TIGR03437 family)
VTTREPVATAVPQSSAGLTLGTAGLYQINAILPPGVARGSVVPRVIQIGDVFRPR